MAKKEKVNNGIGLPSAAMVVIGIAGAIVSGLSFKIIQYWPLPLSVAPYFGLKVGAAWGLVVGAAFGLCLGFLTDDSHFQDSDVA